MPFSVPEKHRASERVRHLDVQYVRLFCMPRFAVLLVILCCSSAVRADVLYQWIFGSSLPTIFEFTLPNFPATSSIKVTDFNAIQNGPANCLEDPEEGCVSEIATTSDPNVISGTNGQVVLYQCDNPADPLHCNRAPSIQPGGPGSRDTRVCILTFPVLTRAELFCNLPGPKFFPARSSSRTRDRSQARGQCYFLRPLFSAAYFGSKSTAALTDADCLRKQQLSKQKRRVKNNVQIAENNRPTDKDETSGPLVL
jgi:hypothetical protein